MRFNVLLLAAISIAAAFFAGCTGSENPANTGGRPANANSNTTVSNLNNPLGTTKPPEASTNNAAPNLAPVVEGYFEALRRKDEAGVKKFLSLAALKYWDEERKSEKKNSLLAILEDSEAPVEEKREVRNEKIEGDSAVAEIKGGSSLVWAPYKFIKENGEWKFASPRDSFALQDLKNPAETSPAR